MPEYYSPKISIFNTLSSFFLLDYIRTFFFLTWSKFYHMTPEVYLWQATLFPGCAPET